MKKKDIDIFIEDRKLDDGTIVRIPHGPDCAKTRAAVARAEGREGPSPSETKCGPAMVNSEAFKTNWETIFGKKVAAGQA